MLQQTNTTLLAFLSLLLLAPLGTGCPIDIVGMDAGSDAGDVEDGDAGNVDDGGALDAGNDAGPGHIDAGSDAGDIDAGDIDAGSDAGDIDAGANDAGVDAGDIDAGDIDAGDIDAGDIDAGDIDAGDIDAGDIDAGSDAGDIDAGANDAGVDAGDVDAGGIDAGPLPGAPLLTLAQASVLGSTLLVNVVGTDVTGDVNRLLLTGRNAGGVVIFDQLPVLFEVDRLLDPGNYFSGILTLDVTGLGVTELDVRAVDEGDLVSNALVVTIDAPRIDATPCISDLFGGWQECDSGLFCNNVANYSGICAPPPGNAPVIDDVQFVDFIAAAPACSSVVGALNATIIQVAGTNDVAVSRSRFVAAPVFGDLDVGVSGDLGPSTFDVTVTICSDASKRDVDELFSNVYIIDAAGRSSPVVQFTFPDIAADPPSAWTCAAGIFDNADGCDCGCGAVDPDCNGDTTADCDVCDNVNSCGYGTCPANIDPDDNAFCVTDCTAPIPVLSGANVGTTVGATNDSTTGCRTSNQRGEVVYSYVVTQVASVSISVDSDFDANHILSVRTTCEALDSEQRCRNTNGVGGTETVTIPDLAAGTELFIFVDAFVGNEGGFSLTVDETPVPLGGSCATPIVIDQAATSGQETGSFANRLNTFNAANLGNCTQYSSNGRDVIYAVDVIEGQTLGATLSHNGDPSLFVLNPCATSGAVCVVGSDGISGPETIAYMAPVSGTYFIVADNYGSFTGSYTLDWSITGP